MAFKSLIALAFAAVAFAAPAPGSLKVSVTPTATSVKSRDITFKATVYNPTSEDIRIIKYGSILDELPTRSFKATKDGKDVTFAGLRVTPNLKSEEAFVTIPAGGSLSAEHKVGDVYDFVTAGVGKYTFEPLATFQFSDNPTDLLTVPTASIELDVTQVDAKASAQLTYPSCSDGNRLNIITAALSEARALAGGAATNIRQEPNSSRYGAYFGNSNRDDVWYTYDRIAGDLASSGTRTLYCTDNHGICNQGIIAYTYLLLSDGNIVGSDIFTCDLFFQYPETHSGICNQGNIRDTRGGIIVHELSHAVALTTDVYGCDAARGLPDDQKKNNADNYACFSGQVHRDYNC